MVTVTKYLIEKKSNFVIVNKYLITRYILLYIYLQLYTIYLIEKISNLFTIIKYLVEINEPFGNY